MKLSTFPNQGSLKGFVKTSLLVSLLISTNLVLASENNSKKYVVNGKGGNEISTVPQKVNYQGFLTDDLGVPITSTTGIDFQFKIYCQLTGGTPVFTSNTIQTPVEAGAFSLEIDVNSSALTCTNDSYLEIIVQNETLTPRKAINSVINSYNSADLDQNFVGDVTGANGISVTSSGQNYTVSISNGAISNSLLANNSVTTGKIANGTIVSADLSSTLTNSLATFPVTSSDIANGAVGNSQLANNAVNSAKIQDGTVALNDLSFTPVDLTSNQTFTGQKTFNNYTYFDDKVYSSEDLKIGTTSISSSLKIYNNYDTGIQFFNSSGNYFGGIGQASTTSNGLKISSNLGDLQLFGQNISFEDVTEHWSQAKFFNKAKFEDDLEFWSDINSGVLKFDFYTTSSDNTLRINGFNGANLVEVLTNFNVSGNLNVSGSKNFVQKHPKDPTKEIVYVCLEGGESGTYFRGTSNLVNGYAEINLPEHFSLVTSKNGLTTQVTPNGECNGIFVVEKTPTKIVVKELMNGKSNASFDYIINGLRLGFENHEVIRDKKIETE